MINKIKNNFLIIIFLTIYLLIGLLSFKDYGVGIEEHFQRSSGMFWLDVLLRNSSLENLQNILNLKLFEIKNFSPQLPSLEIANYYGVLFDLPMAFLEVIFDIQNSENYFFLRHFSNFFIFYLSGIFFYKILILRTSNTIISFLGTTLYLLAPKAYGNSFFDGKDLFFLSILTISFYYYFNYINKGNFKSLLFLALFSAFATSSRIFGLMLPVCFICLFLLELINIKDKNIIFKKLILYLFLYLIFLYLHWPYMWTFNFNNFISFFSAFKVHTNLKVFFNGDFYLSNYLPTSYLPKWIIISTPIYYLFLFFIGFSIYIKRLFLRFSNIKKSSLNNDLWKGKNEKFDFILFICFFQIIVVYLTLSPNLIKGWTHFLFLNFFLIYFSVFTIYSFFIKNRKKKYLLRFFFSLFMLFSCELVYKLIKYHPYQSIFMNNFISKNTKKLYEADYQSLSRADAIKEIIKDTNKEKTIVATASWTPLKNGISLIPPDKRKQLSFTGTAKMEDSDYIYTNYFYDIDTRYNTKYEIPANFYLFKTLYIDDIKVYSIYKKSY